MRARPIVSLPVPLLVLCVLFVAGAAVVAAGPERAGAAFLPIGLGVTIGAAMGIAVALLTRRTASRALVIALAVGLGVWRTAAAFAVQAQPWDAAPVGPIRASGTVQSVEERGASARVVFRIDEVLTPDGLAPPAGLVERSVRALAPYQPRDRIEVSGRVVPASPGMPDGRRLLARGIVGTISAARIVPNGSSDRGIIDATTRAIRAAITDAIDRMLPEPEAALLNGLLVGSAQGTPQSFQQALVSSGTTHIVVVSGFNITLVAGVLLALARPLGRRGTALALIGVWGFAFVAGDSSPTVRAALMATIALLAVRTGRGRDALLALAVTAALQVAVDPTLVSNLSFQLTALATLGLITLEPRVAALLRRLPAPIREPLAATLAAELVTLPVIASTFHQLSLVSPLSNILVAPLIPVATILGAIGVALVLLVPLLAPLVGLVLMVPCSSIVAIIEATARVPSATSPVGDVSPPLIAVYSAALLIWAVAPTPEGRSLRAALGASPLLKPAAIVAVSLVAFSVVALWTRGADAAGPLVVTVMDVGHGDAVFVRTPRGQAMLIDGGPNPPALLAGIGRRMGLVEHSFSVAALSRSDAEHLTGMVAALDRYPARLYVSPVGASRSALEQRWRAAATPDRSLALDAPTTLTVEPDVVMDVFPTLPIPGPPGADPDPQPSLLYRLRYGSTAVLIASSGSPSELARAASLGWPLAADALVVPRHGGRDSLDAALLAAVHPSIAVISVGPRNREDAPTPDTLAALDRLQVFRTDLNGSVELSMDGTSLRVTPERG